MECRGRGSNIHKRMLYSWPRVHKETENEDQAQDQTYILQLSDKNYCNLMKFLPYFSESKNLKAIETEVKLP